MEIKNPTVVKRIAFGAAAALLAAASTAVFAVTNDDSPTPTHDQVWNYQLTHPEEFTAPGDRDHP